MITIGCAGFPVPATRYFKEFLFVEIQETHHALPGMGTIRRWRREAPKDFVFAMLAPPELVSNRANKAAVKDFLGSVRKKFDRVIWEAPTTWDADDAAALAADVK